MENFVGALDQGTTNWYGENEGINSALYGPSWELPHAVSIFERLPQELLKSVRCPNRILTKESISKS
jgi:hypothetical protein